MTPSGFPEAHPQNSAAAASPLPRTGRPHWMRMANPWAVFFSLLIPWLLVGVLLLQSWLQWWTLLPVLLLGVWGLLLDRLLPVPRNRSGWATQAMFGKRLYHYRRELGLPGESLHLIGLLARALPLLVALAILFGVFEQAGWAFYLLSLATLVQLWLLDRLRLLYTHYHHLHPDYTAWAQAEGAKNLAETSSA